MEERLKGQNNGGFASLSSAAAGPSQPPSRPQHQQPPAQQQPASSSPPSHSPRHARPPVGNAFDDAHQDRPPHHHPHHPQQQYARRPAPLANKPPSRGGDGRSRPGTARAGQQAVPGALPPTPVASEGEFNGAAPLP